MAVDLKFYDEDVMLLDEIDGGQSRINYGNITPIKIKNEGKDKARNVIIGACPLNTLDELKTTMSDTEAEKEYKKQLQAASWKTFCLTKDGNYVTELELGNIAPESFLEGKLLQNEPFNDKDTSLFQKAWSFCLEKWGNNSLSIYKNASKSQTAQRKQINIGKKRDIEIKFKLNYERQKEDYNKSNCLVIFPVRIDSRGYGYILSFQFRASDGKCYFGVYKNGKGMVNNLNRTYGTRFLNTVGFLEFDPSKLMGAKIYTNDEDETCFEFMLNGEKQQLYSSTDKNNHGTVMKDTENKYPDAGEMYFDVGLYYGDLGITLSNFSIETESDQQIVYVKSKIDGNAENEQDYVSAISLSYTEG